MCRSGSFSVSKMRKNICLGMMSSLGSNIAYTDYKSPIGETAISHTGGQMPCFYATSQLGFSEVTFASLRP
jgi:hypothetical protein